MSIVLTMLERVAISRRCVKIPIESGGFDDGIVSMNDNAAIFLSVDDGNKKFFSHWNTLFSAYYDELIALGVPAADTFLEANFNDEAGIEFAGNYFYPLRGAPGSPEAGDTINTYLIPLTTGVVVGTTYDWAPVPAAWATTATAGELDMAADFYAMCQMCLTGIDVGVADSSVPGASPANDYHGETHLHITAADTPVGSYVIVSDDAGVGAAGGYVVKVTGVTVANIAPVRVVCGGGTCTAGASTVVRQQLGFWSNAERDNLQTASPYRKAAIEIWNLMTVDGVLGGAWDGFLDDELASLVANDDSRTTQKAENLAAQPTIASMKAAFVAWDVYGDIGAPPGTLNSKFNNAALTAYSAACNTRKAQTIARLAKLVTAAGTLVDGGNGTYSGVPGFVYNRFAWLDRRINRQYGSLRKHYTQIKGTTYMQNLSDNNSGLLADYSTVMVASRLSEDADGTSQIFIDSTVGFSIGDVCYVVDEVVGTELTGLILGLNPSDGAVQLSFDVSNTYLRENLARLYKIL